MADRQRSKKNMIQGIRWMIHLLYPARCPFCDRVQYRPFWEEQEFLCDECQSRTEYVKEPVCKKCGKPISDERTEFCPDCDKKRHVYNQGKALWVYKGDVKNSIYRFKYGNRREYGLFYGQQIAERYGAWIRRCRIEAIVPIPLHKTKKRQRGYNQADLIAQEIGRRLNIPVRKRLLTRCVNTRPQKELNDRERKNNLKKAFKISENKVQLSCVLLVDDIYTTGSTVDEAAAVLLEAGVKQVFFTSVSIGRGH